LICGYFDNKTTYKLFLVICNVYAMLSRSVLTIKFPPSCWIFLVIPKPVDLQVLRPAAIRMWCAVPCVSYVSLREPALDKRSKMREIILYKANHVIIRYVHLHAILFSYLKTIDIWATGLLLSSAATVTLLLDNTWSSGIATLEHWAAAAAA